MFKIPRGTRDFTPEEMQKRRYVRECMQSTFEYFGYGAIQTPIFETLELFTAKSGDSIIDELYAFSDKGGRELALRPELTAPVMRFYVEKLQMQPKPLKLYYFGNCFRYDRPQKGRYREFMQAGCEIIGANTPEAHAELVTMAYSLLRNVGLKNIKLNIGNLNVINSLFTKMGISKESQKQMLPLIDKSMFDDLASFLNEIGIPDNDSKKCIGILQTPEIKKIKEYFKDDSEVLDELVNMKNVLDLLRKSFKVDFEIKLSIARGLDYYKGLVFEIEAPVLGAEKQLCGGGAYDLVSLFGGTNVPTAGFAIGFDRTILALEAEEYKFPSAGLDAYVIPISEDMIAESIKIAQNLRKEGILTDIDLLRRGVGKSLKYASSKNAKKVIILGSKELEKDSVTLRDMGTGNQELVKMKDIYSKIKNN